MIDDPIRKYFNAPHGGVAWIEEHWDDQIAVIPGVTNFRPTPLSREFFPTRKYSSLGEWAVSFFAITHRTATLMRRNLAEWVLNGYVEIREIEFDDAKGLPEDRRRRGVNIKE